MSSPVEGTVPLRGTEVHHTVRGAGPLAVFAHGLGSSRAATRAADRYRLELPLAGAGLRALTYDARGHGETPGGSTEAEYTWRALADDLLALVDHFSPDAPAHLLGSSMGTGAALHAAVARPDRVGRLVLTAPPTAWATRAEQADAYHRMATLAERGATDAVARLLAEPASELFADAANSPSTPDVSPEILPAVLRGAAASDLPSPEELSALRHPTLLLAWVGDPGHPLETAERLNSLLPHATLHVSETAADVATWGERAAEFLAGNPAVRT